MAAVTRRPRWRVKIGYKLARVTTHLPRNEQEVCTTGKSLHFCIQAAWHLNTLIQFHMSEMVNFGIFFFFCYVSWPHANKLMLASALNSK